MRVFCPSCQEPVTIADDLAGKATFCPLCKAAFTAPTLFSPPPPPPTPSAYPNLSLDPTPVPPPRVDPKPSPSGPDQSPIPPPPSGPTKRYGLGIPLDVIQWIAPACLMLAVFLTFFSWNGAFPGGHGVYTQGPWLAITGSHETDQVGDQDVFKLDSPEGEGKKSLKETVRSNWLMLPYILVLLLTTAAAIAFTVLPTLQVKLPPQVEKLMPWRMAVVAVLCIILMVILGYQSLRGFGLENALLARVDESLQAERDKVKKPDEIKAYEIKRDSELGRYNIRHTTALRVAMLSHIIAALAAGLTLALSHRGSRPAPRVELIW